MKIPEFATKKEKIDWLIANKSTLIAQKMAETKHADGMFFDNSVFVNKSDAQKYLAKQDVPEELNVKAIINTTNIMDSYDDVHIDGLWSKSLRENKNILHLQEHKLAFDKIISDGKDLKAKATNYEWKELGFKYDGSTQALVFESNVKKERNPFMHKQYFEGRVKNHSVGMRYVKLSLAVNSEDYEAEKAVWDKYIDRIANREKAEDQGYFWAITEAKVIEGSAVPIGANTATPTLEINEPSKDTQNEPPQGTQISEFKSLIKSILS